MEERFQDALWEFAKLPIDIQKHLTELIKKAETKEDFISSVMIGLCPNCSSKKTIDGDDAGFPEPDAGDTTIGICLDCGYRWCLECYEPLPIWPCSHWER